MTKILLKKQQGMMGSILNLNKILINNNDSFIESHIYINFDDIRKVIKKLSSVKPFLFLLLELKHQ